MGKGRNSAAPVTAEEKEAVRTKDFFDMILPGTVRFFSDHYVVGDSYRCAWAIREYPPVTEEQAILSRLADRTGVTIHIYNRLVDGMEQRVIMQRAERRNKLKTGSNDMHDNIEAEGNLQDLNDLLSKQRTDREILLHCAVFIELKADSFDALKELQSDISIELTRSKISVDKLTLRQREGFLSVLPVGFNQFGAQYERVLPVSSAANLYPFNFSGKTDPHGLYIGRDKFGSNILVDCDRRTDDKTNSNILILGNSGQGKSYLLKLLIVNLIESGKSVICLDPESEYRELCESLGGTYIDFMDGTHIINPLEPKSWGDGENSSDEDTTPEAFKGVTRLSQHIAFLKDFFRAYKDFTDEQIDTLEIMLSKVYKKFKISDKTDYSKLNSEDYPVMSDLYELCQKEYEQYEKKKKHIYDEETLRKVCLGINSMCVGAESKYFNGHTNIVGDKFICFGVRGLLETNKRLKDAMLFNILSFMSNQLINAGNTAASIDELYLFLTNMTAIEYGLHWLWQAESQNNQYAQYLLGKTYLIGEDVYADFSEAEDLFESASRQGNSFAKYSLAKMHLDGLARQSSTDKALSLLRESADLGNQYAQYLLGKILMRGELTEKDTTAAEKLLTSAAEQKNGQAMYLLGKLYLLNDGIPKDTEKAIRWLWDAVEQDNQYAKYQLGKMYLYGQEVERDYNLAVRLLTASADQGNVYAERVLGNYHFTSDNSSVALAAMRLIVYMMHIFRDNMRNDGNNRMFIEKKLRQKIAEKMELHGQKMG